MLTPRPARGAALRLLTCALLLATVALLVGCGGDDSDDATSETTATAAPASSPADSTEAAAAATEASAPTGAESTAETTPETTADIASSETTAPTEEAAAETFTPEEVLEASGGRVTSSAYAVPRQLKKPYVIGFVHLDKANPFFAEWVRAMQDAAELYGVTYIDGDQQSDDAKILDVYNTLKLKEPDVMGAQHATEQLLGATQEDGIPLIGLDASPLPGLITMGIPDEGAGALAGDFLGQAAKERLATDWEGRELYYLGMSAAPCDPCEKRVNAGLEALRQHVDIPDDRVLISREAADQDANRTFAINAATAHPDGVFVIIGLNDPWAIGAMQGLASANRAKDGIGLTLGCDETGIAALRNPRFEGLDLGCVNFNAYAEGWNWMEAAIATAEGDPFEPYEVSQIVTPDQVDEVFPE